MKKNTLIAVAVILGVVIVTGALIFLAQGGSYNITNPHPSKGNADASVVIEEFADFQCPYCAQSAPIVEDVMNAYQDKVKLVFINFPLPEHNKARPVAIAALCAAQQDKFFEFYDRAFADQDTWAAPAANVDDYLIGLAKDLGLNMDDWQTCRRSKDARDAVEADFKDGVSRGVDSTPTFFVNGEKIDIPQSFFAWKQILDSHLQPSDAPQADQPADAGLPEAPVAQ